MGVSSSFILSVAEHIFIDHLVSYALWELSVQPYFPFSSLPTSALPLGSYLSCLPQGRCLVLLLSQACTCTLLSLLYKPLWTPIPKKLSLLAPAHIYFLPKHLFDHPHLMALPYFLTLGCITINIFPYNIHVMISCEFLPQRHLRVMNMPDAFFWIHHSKCPHA